MRAHCSGSAARYRLGAGLHSDDPFPCDLQGQVRPVQAKPHQRQIQCRANQCVPIPLQHHSIAYFERPRIRWKMRGAGDSNEACEIGSMKLTTTSLSLACRRTFQVHATNDEQDTCRVRLGPRWGMCGTCRIESELFTVNQPPYR
jgi:hypothetical protein